jgi:RimJ/RimL family protein N-acetyltransferase
VAQIGYWIAAPSRGCGYASRAVVLLTRWLFGLGAARVFLTIVAGNDGSVESLDEPSSFARARMRSHSVWLRKRRDVLWFAALPQEWPMRSPTEQFMRHRPSEESLRRPGRPRRGAYHESRVPPGP